MSLSGALSNAISGLTAATRSAQIVSSNLANSMTEGYGRRDVELLSQDARGGGVTVLGTVRHRQPALVAEMRDANSNQAAQQNLANFQTKLEQLVGTPDEASSLTARMARFEAALVSAISRPDLAGRLDQVVREAGSVAEALNTASQGLQEMRVAADRQIHSAVERLNTKLSQVQELNVQIAGGSTAKRDVSALVDHRESLITEIASLVPVKEMHRPNQGIALYTQRGALLLDGAAAEFSFTNAHTIVPHMTLDAGHLSGLSLNGVEISVNHQTGPLRGGELAALFQVRDDLAVNAQSELDALARDLTERLQAPGLDPTLASGSPGLFTDAGAHFDASNEVGMAGRISVNPIVDPDQGGASWRLRDGFGAATLGSVGDASLLKAFSTAFNASRNLASGDFMGQSASASDLASLVTGKFGAQRLSTEQNLTFAAVRAEETKQFLLNDGVDSDQEMQKLMQIEQAYAANARVLQTVDDMMTVLMGAIG
ncbi:MAG: flagellar hook-associated protein FlgK [Roseobacter sp.]|nr:flagellar hook-associated protein FlgK [Roseobacter sp.]